jgi:hypothetical protein
MKGNKNKKLVRVKSGQHSGQHTGLEMLFDVVGQTVKYHIERGHRATQALAKQGLQGAGVFKQAVQVQAQHVAGTVLPARPPGNTARATSPALCHGRVLMRLTVVDFIAADLHAGQRGPRVAGVKHARVKTGVRTLHGLDRLKQQ